VTDPREQPAVRVALAELAEVPRRLHDRDAALFSDDPGVRQAVANRLGWLDVAEAPPGWADRIHQIVADVRTSGLDRVVLAGMGGSSLAPEVFATVLNPGSGMPLEVLDSTHPVTVAALLDDADLSGTLVVVASKSGTTEETACFAAHSAELVPGPSHLLAITDSGSELEAQARSDGWRAAVTNPADIGGRFSALSMFGMLPAALAGVDIEGVWDRAASEAARNGPDRAVDQAPAALLAAFMAGHAREGRDKLTLLAGRELAPLGDWVEQLVAESTGKNGVGIVPVVGEPLGDPDVYGGDRAFVAFRLGGQPAPGEEALAAAGRPVLAMDVRDASDLGAAFYRWELATAYAGVLLGVNPFDEPNVTESKNNTRAVLDEVAAGGTLPEPEPGDVRALLSALRPGDYVSLQAYLPPTPAHAEALQRLQGTIRDRWRVAATAGWGPRFLHSTGQLHKGGPNTVVAVQLVDAPEGGPGIPTRPYDFATLVRAQALGDLRSLRAHDRRVARMPLGDGGVDEVAAHLLGRPTGGGGTLGP
jgi:transaldolase / glucose-6-phosphate isomerase